MRIDDLAEIMGKTKEEVKSILESSDIIQLKLTERSKTEKKDAGKVEVIG
jgi:hypothetical protein